MKRIQAYTRTESEVQSLNTSMIALGASHIEVGKLEEPLNKRALLAPLPVNGGNPAIGTAVPVAGVIEVPKEEERMGMTEDHESDVLRGDGDGASLSESDDLNYVLSCMIDERQYDEVVNFIRRHGGYVD